MRMIIRTQYKKDCAFCGVSFYSKLKLRALPKSFEIHAAGGEKIKMKDFFTYT
jgi:hypothetical protein